MPYRSTNIVNLRESRLHYILITAVAAATYIPTLGNRAMKNWDEAIYAASARYMAEDGYWLIPHGSWANEGLAPFLQKPPLMEWTMAISMHIFGFNTFAARLPSVLAGIATMCLCYHAGRKFLDWRAGLASALVLLVTPAWWEPSYSARSAELDAGLIFFGSLFVYAVLWRPTERKWTIIGGLSGAAAFLTKGFAAGPFLIVVIPFMLANLRTYLNREMVIGAAVGLVAAVPWPVYAYLKAPDEFITSFIKRQLARSSGSLNQADALVPTSNYPYLPMMVSSIQYTPTLVTGLVGGAAWWHLDGSRANIRRLAWWGASPVIFYSLLGGTHGWYIKPIVVPLAILTGIGIATIHNEWRLHAPELFAISAKQFVAIGVAFALLIPVGYAVVLDAPTTSSQKVLGESVPDADPDEPVYTNVDQHHELFVFEFYAGRPFIKVPQSQIVKDRPKYLLLQENTQPPSGYQQLEEADGLAVYSTMRIDPITTQKLRALK